VVSSADRAGSPAGDLERRNLQLVSDTEHPDRPAVGKPLVPLDTQQDYQAADGFTKDEGPSTSCSNVEEHTSPAPCSCQSNASDAVNDVQLMANPVGREHVHQQQSPRIETHEQAIARILREHGPDCCDSNVGANESASSRGGLVAADVGTRDEDAIRKEYANIIFVNNVVYDPLFNDRIVSTSTSSF
ncbi:MAG: hypothetical protein ACKPKO_09575, partial [Candidatus Fonsibacter sp.]